MSRSFRHTPITGRSLAESEKDEKAKANRRCRHSANRSLRAALSGDTDNAVSSREHPRSGRAIFRKDGKFWFGERWPEYLRK